MGKPYQSELSRLEETYAWAVQTPLGVLEGFVEAAHSTPLVVVGSGGSSTAAQLAALLHQTTTGRIAKAVTPLELASMSGVLRDASVLLVSAGGRNTDILAAFEGAAVAEPQRLLALSMQVRSPLARLASAYRYAQFVGFDPPAGKDGFLATNSLLAFTVLLLRAYGQLPGGARHIGTEGSTPICGEIDRLHSRQTWIVLHSGWGSPAAVDLESKMTEAALGRVLLSDYRNFGHGRHHWVAKRGEETGIVAIVTPTERDLAHRTLRLLPSEIPRVTIETGWEGPLGTLDLLPSVFRLVGAAGLRSGIDPGRPGVPEFGSRLYHLKMRRSGTTPHSATNIAAIRRKQGPDSTLPEDLRACYAEGLAAHRARIADVTYRSVVLDYDGTLCDGRERFAGPPAEIAAELTRLLDAGAVIGIATGRGKSVRTDLQHVVPQKYWEQVIIGYYNGSDIAPLTDPDSPNKGRPVDPALATLLAHITADHTLALLASCEARPQQLTVEPFRPSWWGHTRAILHDTIAKASIPGVRMVVSSHSIDLLAPGVTKLALVAACQAASGGESLCIGDRGEWPGNDHELLAHPYSLSVDRVSPDVDTCWNISPPGHRGVQATLGYLAALRVADNGFRFVEGQP